MVDGLRVEDVKQALDGMGSALPSDADTYAFHSALQVVVAAARAYLASQEQTPDIEAVAKRVARFEFPAEWPDKLTVHQWRIAHERAQIYVDAALIGFHPQPADETPEVQT